MTRTVNEALEQAATLIDRRRVESQERQKSAGTLEHMILYARWSLAEELAAAVRALKDPMTDTLQALISDLRSATGPDRLLDARCWDLLDARPREDDGSGEPPIYKRDPEDSIAFDAPPRFTDSVDAALNLVPPRTPATVVLEPEGTGYAIVTVGRRPFEATGRTPAIALCIASLMAMVALETTDDR